MTSTDTVTKHQCDGWLYHLLINEPNHLLPTSSVYAAGEAAGFSDRLIRLAAARIGVDKLAAKDWGVPGSGNVYRLSDQSKYAASIAPKVPARITLAQVQAVYDQVFAELGGGGVPLANCSKHVTERFARVDAVERELRSRLEELGVEVPARLTNPVAQIINGHRPIAFSSAYPEAIVSQVDTRATGVREAQEAAERAERAAKAARSHLDTVRAAAAT